MAIRERLDALSRGELAGLIVVVALTLAGVGLWYSRSLPRQVSIAASGGATAAPVAVSGSPSGAAVAASPGATASPSAAPIVIDVTGWVKKPGVYEFAQGDRVIDAVNKAGGPKHGADLTTLNLAAPLTDGTQVIVPKAGAAPPGTVAGGTTGGTTSAAGGSLTVNVNTATEPELETLTGVGPVLAAAIIAYREQHGPFTSVDQLQDVSGIGPATLEELRTQVTV